MNRERLSALYGVAADRRWAHPGGGLTCLDRKT